MHSDYVNKILGFGERDFKDHKVEVLGGTPGEGLWALRWQKPGSYIDWMDIIHLAGAIFIRGDLGEAVYVWNGGNVHPNFLLGCDLDYFLSKVEASEKGTRYTQWDEKTALEWITDQRDFLIDHGDCHPDDVDDLLDDLRMAAGSEQEWSDFLREEHDSPYDRISKIMGQDAYWDSDLPVAGSVPHVRAILHWQGLKMALKQLGFGKEGEYASGN